MLNKICQEISFSNALHFFVAISKLAAAPAFEIVDYHS